MKIFALVFAAFLFASCGNQNSNDTGQSTATTALVNSSGAATSSDYSEGARLVTANDCLTCHKVDSASIGPSFKAIAEKYPTDQGVVENLTHSIIHGSRGIWGQKEMTPHPSLDPKAANEMCRYILSLNVTDSTATDQLH